MQSIVVRFFLISTTSVYQTFNQIYNYGFDSQVSNKTLQFQTRLQSF